MIPHPSPAPLPREADLEASRQRLQALFDNALDAILLMDDHGRYVDANPAAEALTGYRREELLELSIPDLTAPTDEERHEELWSSFVAEGQQRGEHRILRKDGSVAIVEYRAVANIQPGLHLAFLVDITERRKVEGEVRQHAERLDLMLRQMPAALWNTDRELRFTDLLGAGLEPIEVEPAILSGLTLYELFDTHDPDFVPVKAHLEALRGQAVTYDVEFRGRRFHAHVEPFQDSQGGIQGVTGIALDVTERTEAEAALRASEERYRRFFEEDLTGDCVATPDGEIVTCNQSFADIFGFPSIDEALGTHLTDLFPDEEARREFLRGLTHRGKLERFEGVGRRLSGEPVHLISNVVGTFDEAGELQEFRAYLFDDTEHRQAEDQLRQAQKMEAVGRLAGGIAHDFNNLVTAINGYSDLLLARLDDGAEGQRELQEIRSAGDRAAALTRQLLAFSRSQMMRREVLDLNEVVTATESILQRLLGEDVRLISRLAPEAGRVKADRGQVEQVILNLAVNSRDAMPRGGELVIETSAVELEGGCRDGVQVVPGPYVLLAVTDTGEGMEPEVLNRVFEPFFTTKEPGRGTGLGLPTAYGIVKQSGGYIFGDSKPGQGTTFELYLPRAREAATEATGRPEAARNGHCRGETILVVEDEEPVRNLLGQILETRGYSVLQAANGREALDACRTHRGIDLVISDVVMPDMRGPALGERIAALLPGAPVLYISGYPGHAIAQRGELPDGSPFLQKPFTQDALIRTVRELLD